MIKNKELFLICGCGSFEHQMFLWYDKKDFPELYMEIHLITHRNFFKRLWHGLKYSFGHTSNYGAWDSFIMEKEEETKLFKFLKERNENSIRHDGKGH